MMTGDQYAATRDLMLGASATIFRLDLQEFLRQTRLAKDMPVPTGDSALKGEIGQALEMLEALSLAALQYKESILRLAERDEKMRRLMIFKAIKR